MNTHKRKSERKFKKKKKNGKNRALSCLESIANWPHNLSTFSSCSCSFFFLIAAAAVLINCPSFHYNHNNISGQSTVKGWKWQWQGIFSVLSIRKLLQWLTTLSPQSVTENARKLLQLVLGSVLVDQCQSLSAVVQYFAVYLRKCRQLLFEIASGLIFCTTACLPLSPSRCLCVSVFSSQSHHTGTIDGTQTKQLETTMTMIMMVMGIVLINCHLLALLIRGFNLSIH